MKICRQCSKEFKPPIKAHNRQFCSQKCSDLSRVERRIYVPKTRKNTFKEIDPEYFDWREYPYSIII